MPLSRIKNSKCLICQKGNIDESHFTHQFYPSQTLQSVNKNPWKPTFLLIFEIIMHFSLRKVTPRKNGCLEFFLCPRTKMKNWSVPAPGFFRFGGTKNRQIFGKRDPNIFSPAAVFFSKHSLVGWFFEIGRLKRVQGGGKKHKYGSNQKNFWILLPT